MTRGRALDRYASPYATPQGRRQRAEERRPERTEDEVTIRPVIDRIAYDGIHWRDIDRVETERFQIIRNGSRADLWGTIDVEISLDQIHPHRPEVSVETYERARELARMYDREIGFSGRTRSYDYVLPELDQYEIDAGWIKAIGKRPDLEEGVLVQIMRGQRKSQIKQYYRPEDLVWNDNQLIAYRIFRLQLVLPEKDIQASAWEPEI